mmetsp:Transcript_48327/g.114567  ORF Transcript_48327/g.114567 Transcript_48327/m.114567 type:complete len:271 (-) Transcript_48327:3027-3839(-)
MAIDAASLLTSAKLARFSASVTSVRVLAIAVPCSSRRRAAAGMLRRLLDTVMVFSMVSDSPPALSPTMILTVITPLGKRIWYSGDGCHSPHHTVDPLISYPNLYWRGTSDLSPHFLHLVLNCSNATPVVWQVLPPPLRQVSQVPPLGIALVQTSSSARPRSELPALVQPSLIEYCTPGTSMPTPLTASEIMKRRPLNRKGKMETSERKPALRLERSASDGETVQSEVPLQVPESSSALFELTLRHPPSSVPSVVSIDVSGTLSPETKTSM